MFEQVKERLSEVIGLAETCPEKYQLKCFEVLLQALVAAQAIPVPQPATSPSSGTPVSITGQVTMPLTQLGITQDQLDKVYHSDGSTYTIIVQDLKAKPTSQKQVRLALLLGLMSLIGTGEPTVPKDDLVALCRNYSVYDSPNFTAHMKKNKQLFAQKGNGWTLTVPGRQRAAELIKELAQ